MNHEPAPDQRIVVSLQQADTGPLVVMHRCRCDAPDPEAARMEPIEAPLARLRDEGSVLVVCDECDSHILVVAADRSDD